MSRLEVPGTLRLAIGVLAERRPGVTPWAAWAWRAVEVLEAAPELPPWTLLREAEGRSLFFAGTAELAFYPTDTANYLDNLQSAAPSLWVVLRPVLAAPGYVLQAVTADTGEAHVYADSGADLLEAVKLPPGLQAVLADFVARHHVERAFHKRRRDRADPEALGIRPRGGGR